MTSTETTSTPDLSERAARLRLAVNRMARRMRQEAITELGPASIAALATIERSGPLTPSELARIEGIQRPTATRILGRLTEDGLVTRTSRPERRALRDRPDLAGRPQGPEPAPQAQERLTWRRRCGTSPTTTSPRWRALRRSSSRCSRRVAVERRRPSFLRIPRDPQLPPLLRRPGRLAGRQLDADRRRALAGPAC